MTNDFCLSTSYTVAVHLDTIDVCVPNSICLYVFLKNKINYNTPIPCTGDLIIFISC